MSIKGKRKQANVYSDKPNVNYRKLDALNQSMLKLFDTNPIRFYEEFKRGKKRKDKKSVALILGDLVDFYILECAGDDLQFDARLGEKFALFDGVKGSGQVFRLADNLFEETELCINDKGEVTCSFQTRFEQAFEKSKAAGDYKGKDMEKALEDFMKNAKDYFAALMDNIGKTVIDVSMIDKAKVVAIKLMKDDFTYSIFRGTEDQEYMTHFPIEWTYFLDESRTIRCKSELDVLVIDHAEKTIQPIDLKTTYDNESFDYNYIKNCYYLQNAFYSLAVTTWARENGLEKYEVKPMKFVVGDTSSNNRRPLIYQTSADDLKAGILGFRYRGQDYRGVDELVNDIAWAEENNEWSCSRQAFKNKGKMNLKIDYEK